MRGKPRPSSESAVGELALNARFLLAGTRARLGGHFDIAR